MAPHTGASGPTETELAEKARPAHEPLQEMGAALAAKVAELTVHTAHLEALNEIILAVSQSLDLQGVMETALDQVLGVTRAEAGVLFAVDPSTRDLLLRASRGITPEYAAAIARIPWGKELAGYIAARQEPIRIDSLSEDPRISGITVRQAGVRAFMGTPILARGILLGVLDVFNYGARSFTDSDLQLLATIGQQVGVAMERAQLQEEREQAEAAKLQLAAIVEDSDDAIIGGTLEGIVTSWNKGAERLLGYMASEIIGQPTSLLVPSDRPEEIARILERIKTGEHVQHYETRRRRKDGRIIEVSLTVSPIRNGEGRIIGASAIARDITERKQAEAALQQANEKLTAWVHELEQRTREITLLSEMAELLHACRTAEEAYTVIAKLAQQLFPEEAGVLAVISASRNLVESLAVWGSPPPGESLFAPEECWALRRGRVHLVEDTRFGLLCQHLSRPLPGGYLCVPMMAHGEALGVLHLSQPEAGRLSQAKQRLAATVAEHVGLAVANLKLRETLRNQAIRDLLTGLLNRRYMEEALEREVARAKRAQHPLGIIMLDLDYFKRFNDTFGHDAGDLLLHELGSFLRSHSRAEDIACRYGGEEFTLILPDASPDPTERRANQLREAIKQLNVEHRGQLLGPISVSLGVACFPDHGQTGAALLQAADAALYRAKAAGRDRVVVAALAEGQTPAVRPI